MHGATFLIWQVNWIREQIETKEPYAFSKEVWEQQLLPCNHLVTLSVTARLLEGGVEQLLPCNHLVIGKPACTPHL